MSPQVNYVELFEQFDFYFLQFYNSYGQLNPSQPNNPTRTPTYPDVASKYPGKEYKLIAGALTNPGDGAQGYNAIGVLSPILTKLMQNYRGFGGVYGWTYQNAVVGNARDPYGWAKAVWTALRMKLTAPVLQGE